MNIPYFFIKRPVTTILFCFALLISGVLGYLNLPVADLPAVDFPVIMVSAQQPGGSPEEIASSVAAPLERRLGQIAGVNEMTSRSTQNRVRIILQFDLSRDINGAARDVEAALQAARADLPSSMRSNPSYFKMNPSGAPIVILALTSSTRTMPELYNLASNTLLQHLSAVKGVGQVELGGSALPAIRVEINPLPLFRLGVGFEDIRAALASANAHSPKGFIEDGQKRYQIETNDQVTKAAMYKDLIIAYRNNRPVRLEDVAHIHDSVEDIRNAGYFNRHNAILAIISPQANANIIETVDQIKKQLKIIRHVLPPDVELSTGIDRSVTIRSSLDHTRLTLIVAIILVIGVVLVFLQTVQSAIIPAIIVPSSIITTFGVMKLMGFSLNNLSLMALTIATGFVVDDAIVVLENITRHLESGKTRWQAALDGAREICFTVVSITVSLIAVFLPIILMGGLIGRLFHEFAMTITIALLVSMVLSLTLTPMMCSRLLAAHHAGQQGPRVLAGVEKLLSFSLRLYEHSLDWVLRHRLVTLLSLPATIALFIGLFIIMPKGFFPTQDTGILIGHLRADQSISFQAMQGKMSKVQSVLMAEPDVAAVSSVTGGRSVNQGNFYVQLKDKSVRKDEPIEMIARVGRKLKDMTGARFFISLPGGLRSGARSGDATYQYTLLGDSSEELYHWMPRLIAQLQKHPQLRDISSDIERGGKSLMLSIDRDTAARTNLTPQLISNTLYDAFGQRAASIIYNPLNQYRVIMEVMPEFWKNPDVLKQMRISTSGGSPGGSAASNTIRVKKNTTSEQASQDALSFANQIANSLAGGRSASNGSAVSTRSSAMIPLSLVTTSSLTTTPLSVNHQGGAVATTMSFNLSPGVSLSKAVEVIKEAGVTIGMPPTIRGEFAGNAKQFQKTVSNEPILILAALAAVYIVLGVLYESYIHPLTILSTLPSAGVGALLALYMCGEEFSLMGILGVILLVGIVKKNAILLVDFAIIAERDHDMSSLEAIRTACLLRFRPIIMTSIAAMLGALPLLMGHGYGIELRRPLGIAIIGGLLVSQALTLYTTPVVYLYLDRLQRFSAQVKRRLFRSSRQTESS